MDRNELFIGLVTKFCATINKSPENLKGLNTILNDLITLEYKNVPAHDIYHGVKLLETITKIPVRDGDLVSKSCGLINSLVKQQKMSLQESVVESLILWLLNAARMNYSTIGVEIFTSLTNIFREHCDKVIDFHQNLIGQHGILLNSLNNFLCHDKNANEDITLSVMVCVELFLGCIDGDDHPNSNKEFPIDCLTALGNTTLGVIFCAEEVKFGEHKFCSLMTSSLNVCRIVSTNNRDWARERVGDLLGAAKAFILYKIENVVQTGPRTITISQQPLFDSSATVAKTPRWRATKQRKPKSLGKLKTDTGNSSVEVLDGGSNSDGGFGSELFNFPRTNRTSDSDFSETESKRAMVDLKRQARLRHIAIILTGTLAKISENHVFFGYWHALFPSGNSLGHSISLLNCLLRDPSPNSRIVVSQTITYILYGSKPFLSQADLSEKTPSSFTPFSLSLGNMIKLIYLTIVDGLTTDGSVPVIIQILKCLTVLVQNTSFEKLPARIIKSVIFQVRRLLHHKTLNIQMAALIMMATIITSLEGVNEVSKLLDIKVAAFRRVQVMPKMVKTDILNAVNDDDDEEEEVEWTSDVEEEEVVDANVDEQQVETIPIPWLLKIVLENLGVELVPSKYKVSSSQLSTRNESLQVLAAMGMHFLYLRDHFLFVSTALRQIFEDPNVELRIGAVRCLASIATGGNSFLMSQAPLKTEDVTHLFTFWRGILPSVMTQLQCDNVLLKTYSCDCLSEMGMHVFERLQQDTRMKLISMLSGCGINEDVSVRAAAIRALAIYILYPSMTDDFVFIENTAESIIDLMKDSTRTARIKASWSLGNISDVLVINNKEQDSETINDQLLKRMIETIVATNDKTDIICSNLMRSAGQILSVLSEKHFDSPEWSNLFISAVNKMISTGLNKGSAKVKRNACYSIGILLQNPHIYRAKCCTTWQNIIFPCLCNVLLTVNNFKVRIYAAVALSTPEDRSHYNITHFLQVWRTLVTALEQTDEMVDFNEYKHRDNLIDQLCVSISHILALMVRDDLCPFANELLPRIDVAREFWTRVVNRVLPEKAAPLHLAALKLSEFKTSGLSVEQRQALETLRGCFVANVGV